MYKCEIDNKNAAETAEEDVNPLKSCTDVSNSAMLSFSFSKRYISLIWSFLIFLLFLMGSFITNFITIFKNMNVMSTVTV